MLKNPTHLPRLPELIESIAALDGTLAHEKAEWDPRPAIGVVVAADGYPAKPRIGDAIDGLDAALEPGVKIFHAGTRDDDGRVVSAGGRVLTVCAIGDDLGVSHVHTDDPAARRLESLANGPSHSTS